MKNFRICSLMILAAFAVLFQFDAFGVQTTVTALLSVDPGAVALMLAVPAVVAPFPVDSELTSIVVAYKNGKLIADDVMPRSQVGSLNFKYKKFALADGITIPNTKVGRKSIPTEVEFGYTEVDSSCEDYGLDDIVPNRDINTSPAGYDPVAHAARSIIDLVLLDREARVSGMVFNTDNYAAANKATLSGTSQWSDYTNSNPVKAILDALDTMVMRANKIVFGQAVWTAFRQHPKVIKATNKNSGDVGIAARQAVAELLELDEVIVGSGWYNSAKKGQTVVNTRVWGKSCAMIYQDPMASISDSRVTFGLTAQFGSRVSGQIAEPKVGLLGSVRVRSGEIVREVILANDLGYLFDAAIA